MTTVKERQRLAAQRPTIIKAIVALERKYGESAVSGAFDRHRTKRRLLRRARDSAAAIAAKIRGLES